MRKTKEYISDVQQKIIELHKLESDFKKKARAVKTQSCYFGKWRF